MKCEHARELLLDLIYDELASERRAQVEDHIAACEKCAREYEGLKQTLLTIRSLPDPELPPFLNTRLQAQAREALGKPRPLWAWVMRPGVAAAAVVVIAASVVIIIAGREYQGIKAPARSMTGLELKEEAPGPIKAPAPSEAKKAALEPGPAPAPGLKEMEKARAGRAGAVGEGPPALEAGPVMPEIRKRMEAPEGVSAERAVGWGEADRVNELADELMGSGGRVSEPVYEAEEKAIEVEPPAARTFAPQSIAGPEKAAKKEAMPGAAPEHEAFDYAAAEEKGEEKAPLSALKVAPEAPADLIKRAEGLEKSGEYREALALYERALSLLGHGQDARARDEKLRAKPEKTAEPDRARAALEKDKKAPVPCSPDLKNAATGASRCYKKLGRKPEARGLEKWYKSFCRNN